MSSSNRLTSLDGLRGIAALIVVIHHCLLVSPALAAAYYGGEVEGTFRQWLAYSPLHVLWGGAEAVVVFFVLSGLVLVLAIQSPRFDWFAYFPSRLARLCVPVAGAVVLGLAVLSLPLGDAPASPWLDRADGYPLRAVLSDLVLLGGTSGSVSPLWTLRWEIIFSLLLPAFAYAARVIPAWAFGVACVALSSIGAWQDVAALQFLPIFGLGVALAGEWDRIGDAVQRMRRRTALAAWPILGVVAVLGLSTHWLLARWLPHDAASGLAQTPILLGAVLLVVMAAHCPPLGRILSLRGVTWLGAISFSLYLVHEPVVLLFAHLTDAARYTLVLAVPVSLLVAWGFSKVVEQPAHRLARRVRDNAATREAARRGGHARQEDDRAAGETAAARVGTPGR